jgi:2,4'-dihydroxyacetophenone dioxygenase
MNAVTNLAAPKLNRVPVYQPLCFDSSKSPWVPFTPYSDEIKLKMLHVDLVTGQVVYLFKAPQGSVLGKHSHYGSIHVYTLRGSWGYEEHDWVANAGDFVYEVANSTHTFKAIPGDDLELFIVFEGSVAFWDDKGNQIGFETALTMQQRHIDYCLANNIPLVELNDMPHD